MSSTVKIKLQRGNDSIDVEAGSYEEASMIIDRYWNIEPVGTGTENGETRKHTPRKTVRSNNGIKTESTSPKINATEWANKIKGDSRFETFEKKVLDEKDIYRKVALVSWFVGEDIHLSSGDLNRILAALGVKVSTANISTSLSRNTTKFFTADEKGPGNSTLYKMVGKARKEFEEFLEK